MIWYNFGEHCINLTEVRAFDLPNDHGVDSILIHFKNGDRFRYHVKDKYKTYQELVNIITNIPTIN